MSGVQKAIKYGAMAFGIFLIVAIIGGTLSILGFFHLLGKGDVLDTPRTYPIAQDVNSLELEISAARLNIVQGDTFALESNLEKLEILQEGGKLTLRESEKSWFFLGSEGFVTLTVPQACVLDEVERAQWADCPGLRQAGRGRRENHPGKRRPSQLPSGAGGWHPGLFRQPHR